MKLIKEFSGHSGCNVSLYEDSGSYFVRKKSGSELYNRRLMRQLIKQKHFDSVKIKVPRILGYGKERGLLYFDMEYIQGVTLGEAIRHAQFSDIERFIDLLFHSLPLSQEKKHVDANALFKRKIAEIAQRIRTDGEIENESLAILERYDFSEIPFSHCCGDLTMENIIFSTSGQIYLIDLLDSFFNSWLMDVAKLLQDLELGWSYRHERRDFNINLRLATVKDILLLQLLSLPGGCRYVKHVYVLLLLNVLRIIPYIKEKASRQFVDEALPKVIRKIYEIEEQL